MKIDERADPAGLGMRASRIFAAIALFALASAAPAGALTLAPACAGDCFGANIEADVTLTRVRLTMDFENYVGRGTLPPRHPVPEGIAFKLYTNDDVVWTFDSSGVHSNPFTSFNSFVHPGLNNNSGGSSFKARFGPHNRGPISEAMIPEPAGAAMFLIGGVVMSSAVRRRRA